jgi:hypothetical protein
MPNFASRIEGIISRSPAPAGAVPRQIGRFGEHGAIPSLESLFAVLGELGVAKAAIGPAMNEDDLRLLREACDQADERLIELKDEIPYLGFVGFDFF